MNKKNVFLISALTVALVLVILLILSNLPKEPQIIGGDRDSHGCLGPAGYSWSEDEQECVRSWEEGELRYQINSFESCIDAGYPILESYPRQCRTPSGRNFIEPTETKNYISSSVDECKLIKFMCAEGKKPFFDEFGCGCEDEKITYCDSENRPEACTKEYLPVCGHFNENIQCIKAPCAETYGNACVACSDEKVSYWTEGECN